MVKFVLTLLLILQMSYGKPDKHPVHLSVTTVEYNESNDEYTILIRIFTDDLETIINKLYDAELNLSKSNENENSNKYIKKYLQERLVISINKKNLSNHFELTGMEHDPQENVTFLYLRSPNIRGNKVAITNILLTDLYDNQKNLLIFTYKNKQEAFTFEKNKTNFEFYIR